MLNQKESTTVRKWAIACYSVWFFLPGHVISSLIFFLADEINRCVRHEASTTAGPLACWCLILSTWQMLSGKFSSQVSHNNFISLYFPPFLIPFCDIFISFCLLQLSTARLFLHPRTSTYFQKANFYSEQSDSHLVLLYSSSVQPKFYAIKKGTESWD